MKINGVKSAMPHFISPLDFFLIFLHPNTNTTKVLRNPSFFRKYLRDVLVVSEWYLDGKGKIDSRLLRNDIWGRMTEELKLTIFTYKWRKCGKNMEKCSLESLIKQGFPSTSKISHSRLS